MTETKMTYAIATQKLTPALGVAVENGTITKTVEKRVAKYQLKVE